MKTNYNPNYMKDLNYPISEKKCAHCGSQIDIYSNAQKFCSREDSPECCDDRYFQAKWDKLGKEKYIKFRTNPHK